MILAGYNESDNVMQAMERMYEMLAKTFETFELIMVDDASKDDTAALMEAFAGEHDGVKVVRNYVNLNFGTSVLRGMAMAQNEYVTFTACDLPIAPEDIGNLICEMDDDVDLLVMERKNYVTTKWRSITSKGNTILLRILYPKLTRGTPVLNYSQIFRRRIIPDIIPLARSPIFVWPELIFRAKLLGVNWINVPVECRVTNLRRGAFGHPHDIIWGMYDMIRFRIRLWSGNY